MNKKGQMLGIILTAFMVAIVGLALYAAVVQTVGNSLTAISAGTDVNNVTVVIPAASASIDITGQDLLSTPTVWNSTTNFLIGAGNYTIDETVSTTTGVKTIQFTSAALVDAGLIGTTANITMVYGTEGYIADSGARGMANLIPIFMALAIAIVALSPTLRNGVIDLMKGN